MTLSATLRSLREQRGLSLSALATKAGVAKSYLHRLERSEGSARPSADVLVRIANALGVSPGQLLVSDQGGVEQPLGGLPDELQAYARRAQLTDDQVALLEQIVRHFSLDAVRRGHVPPVTR